MTKYFSLVMSDYNCNGIFMSVICNVITDRKKFVGN